MTVCLLQVNEDLSRHILEIKEVLYGDTEKFPDTEAVQQITAEVFQTDFLSMLIEAVPHLEFDVSTTILKSTL